MPDAFDYLAVAAGAHIAVSLVYGAGGFFPYRYLAGPVELMNRFTIMTIGKKKVPDKWQDWQIKDGAYQIVPSLAILGLYTVKKIG